MKFRFFLFSILLASCATQTVVTVEPENQPRPYVFRGINQNVSANRTPAADIASSALAAEFAQVRTVLQLESLILKLNSGRGTTAFFENLPDADKVAAVELIFVGALRGLRPRLENAGKEYKFKPDALIEAILGYELKKLDRIYSVKAFLDGIGLSRTQPFSSPERLRGRLAEIYLRLRSAADYLEAIPEGRYSSALCAFGCLSGQVINRSYVVAKLSEINSRIAFVLAFKLDGLFEAIRLTNGRLLEPKPLSRDDVFKIHSPTSLFMTKLSREISDEWLRNAHQHLRQSLTYQEEYETSLTRNQTLTPHAAKRFELQRGTLQSRTDFPISKGNFVQVELITFYRHAVDDLKKLLPTRFSSRGGFPTEWSAKNLNVLFPSLTEDANAEMHINAFMPYWPGKAPFPLGTFLKTR